MFSCIRPAQYSQQILNDTRAPAKDFGIFIIEIQITNIFLGLCQSYYIPQNAQNTISQTALKHYNTFINVITEALRWVQITIDTRIKIKVETLG